MPKTKPPEPQTFMFADDGSVPNNAHLPFVLYRRAIDLIGSPAPSDPQIVQKRSASGMACLFAHVFASRACVLGPRSRIAVSMAMGSPHRAQKNAPVGFT